MFCVACSWDGILCYGCSWDGILCYTCSWDGFLFYACSWDGFLFYACSWDGICVLPAFEMVSVLCLLLRWYLCYVCSWDGILCFACSWDGILGYACTGDVMLCQLDEKVFCVVVPAECDGGRAGLSVWPPSWPGLSQHAQHVHPPCRQTSWNRNTHTHPPPPTHTHTRPDNFITFKNIQKRCSVSRPFCYT